ncbi:MAG: DUF4097 family beta strand repeat-containing protein [Candidatus Aminicenantes bacterium]|nr:DUF4097 family beta strand repeat-containing protein [Candidatus Aminicenantes bacterium]
MKKREIVIVVLLIVFGVVYNVVEKGRIRFAGDFSRYFDPMRLVSDRYSEFPQNEKIFPAPGKITIANPAGEITIDKSLDNQVHLFSFFRVYFQDKEDTFSKKIVQHARVLTQVENNELTVSADCRPEFPFNRLRVRLQLLVPAGVVLALDNREGIVSIRHCGKDIFLRQENGNVVLEDIPSAVKLELTHGNLHAKNIAGNVAIATRQSEIFLEDAAAVRLQARHADCELKKIAGPVWIEHAYGRITLDGAGQAEVYGRHSQIAARNIRNGLKLSNAFDGILLENIHGDVSVSGRSSKIEMRQVIAKNMVIENSFADTVIEGYSGETLNALIKNGNFALSSSTIAERLNVESSYARIDLLPGAWADPAFNLKTSHGRIYNQSSFSMELFQEKDESFANRSGQKPEVVINNVYGDIYLK